MITGLPFSTGSAHDTYGLLMVSFHKPERPNHCFKEASGPVRMFPEHPLCCSDNPHLIRPPLLLSIIIEQVKSLRLQLLCIRPLNHTRLVFSPKEGLSTVSGSGHPRHDILHIPIWIEPL